jgi:hypothetical protein
MLKYYNTTIDTFAHMHRVELQGEADVDQHETTTPSHKTAHEMFRRSSKSVV